MNLKKENLDIRILAHAYGIQLQEIARKMGISREYFSRCLARKLKPEMRRRILSAVQELRGGE